MIRNFCIRQLVSETPDESEFLHTTTRIEHAHSSFSFRGEGQSAVSPCVAQSGLWLETFAAR